MSARWCSYPLVLPILAAGLLREDVPIAVCRQPDLVGVFWAADKKVKSVHLDENTAWTAERELPLAVPISPGTPLHGITRPGEFNGMVWPGIGGINVLYEDLLAWGDWKFFVISDPDVTSKTRVSGCGREGFLSVVWADADGRLRQLHWGKHNVWVPTRAEIVPEGMPALPLQPGQQVHALCRADESDVVAWPGQGCVHMVQRSFRAGSAGWRASWKYSKFSAPGVSSGTPLSLTGRAGHLTVYWAGDGKVHTVDVDNQTGTATVGPLPPAVPVYRGTPVHAFSGDGGSAGIVWAGDGGVHHMRSDGNMSTSRWTHERRAVGLPRSGPPSSWPLSDLQEKVLAWVFFGACLLCVSGRGGTETPQPTKQKTGTEEVDSELQLQRLREVFKACDAKGDGSISVNELIKGVREKPEAAEFFGISSETHQDSDTRAAVMRFFHGVGKDNKRKISFQEFERCYRDPNLPSSPSGGKSGPAPEAESPDAQQALKNGRSEPSRGRRSGLALLAALLAAPFVTVLAVYEKNKLKVGNGVDFPGSLQGFSVMITGSSSGMGFEAARYFYILGADVVMHGPSENRTRHAAERVLRAAGSGDGQGSALPVFADLSDFDAVRRLADDMRSSFAVRGLNALVLNAAAMYSGEAGKRGARTAQRPGLSYEAKSGHDFVMAANHLGHFLLATELANTLAPKATVVVLTGSGAWHGDFERLFQGATARIKWEEDFEEAYKAYYDSKLANVCFSRGLRRWLQKGSKPDAPRVVLFDPGRVHTAAALQRNSTEYTAHSYAMWHDHNVGVMKNGLGWRSVSPQDAGWHLVMATFASVSPEPDLVSTYFFPRELFWWYADAAMSKWRTEHVPIAADGTPYWAYVNLQANAYQTFSWGTSHLFSSFGPNCGHGVTSEREHWRWSAKQLGMNPDTLFW